MHDSKTHDSHVRGDSIGEATSFPDTKRVHALPLTIPRTGTTTLTGEELRKIAGNELKIICHHHFMWLYQDPAPFTKRRCTSSAFVYEISALFLTCDVL